MTEIKLYNTATRQKEPFAPLDAQNVRIYACGPTVYDRAHLGNGRSAVVFDTLARLMRAVYPRVTFVRNITDVDDKINARAASTGRSIRDITEETVGWYREDMAALGCAAPDHEPRATEYIDQMIAMSEDLIAKGHAYEAEGHVLFRVRSYEAYGALSGRSVDDMIAGARVEVAPFKEDPMDFVLWKPAGDGPGWESPWGQGRPGWHIECSAMAKELLGETFDIHGGGLDLQFPHHENEIAQSVCAHGAPMARFWMHNEMLQVEGKKMSKSLGNFFTVRELLDQGYPGQVIRFVLLSTHYRKPMDWTEKKAEEARKKLDKWSKLLEDRKDEAEAPIDEQFSETVTKALCDDLNTPAALMIMDQLFSNAKSGGSSSGKSVALLKAAMELVGLERLDVETIDLSKFGAALAQARTIAVESKDFTRVDEIKSQLLAAGVEVRMSKDGVDLSAGPNFDASKLEGL